MPKKPAPAFIREMPLRADRMQLHAVTKRFEVLHFPCNADLQDMPGRLDAMRAEPRFGAACKMPKKAATDRATRNALFAALRAKYKFSEFAAHDVVARHVRASAIWTV